MNCVWFADITRLHKRLWSKFALNHFVSSFSHWWGAGPAGAIWEYLMRGVLSWVILSRLMDLSVRSGDPAVTVRPVGAAIQLGLDLTALL